MNKHFPSLQRSKLIEEASKRSGIFHNATSNLYYIDNVFHQTLYFQSLNIALPFSEQPVTCSDTGR